MEATLDLVYDHLKKQTVAPYNVVAVDAEWVVHLTNCGFVGKVGKVALIQLSYYNEAKQIKTLVLRVHGFKKLPVNLLNILRYIPVVGRNVGGDLAKIGRDFEMSTLHDESTRVELGKMAKDRAVVPSGSVSLQELTKIVLEKHLDKSFQVSNWNEKNLNAGE